MLGHRLVLHCTRIYRLNILWSICIKLTVKDLLYVLFSEKDTNGDVLWTWSYPAVTEQQRSLFMRKSCLTEKGEHFVPFLYNQLERTWYYIYSHKTEDKDNLPKVCLPFCNLCIHNYYDITWSDHRLQVLRNKRGNLEVVKCCKK